MGDSPVAACEASPPYRIPYQVGLFAAVNAIADAYLVIDGPDCVFRKAEWVHGKHDLRSTLLDVRGVHRVAHTSVNADAVIKSRGEGVVERIRQIDDLARPSVVMVCSMPHVMIIGTQYDRLLRGLAGEVTCPLWELPSRSLEADWLDGYAAVLEAVAERVELAPGALDRTKVAVVGHLMHRNEEDCRADVRELRRLFELLGLELTSVWLDGGPLTELSRAGQAGTIVALPLGRRAAQVLAGRTGATVVEVDTPVGATRTRRMLAAVARATGRAEVVHEVVYKELTPRVQALEWVVPRVFVGRRAALAASPDVLGGLAQICLEVGVEPCLLTSPSSDSHRGGPIELDGATPTTLFAPTHGALEAAMIAAQSRGPIDLAMGDSMFLRHTGRCAAVPLGFPSFTSHALFDRPTLGFVGWASLLDRMAEALASLRG